MASDLGRDFVMTAVGRGTDTKPIDKIVVRGNHIVFNDNASSGAKSGLMQAHGKPISYIEISDNYFEMASPRSVIWPVGVQGQQINFKDPYPDNIWYTYTDHLKVSGNTFNKMKFGVWVDNYSFHDQVRNLEYVNNTCLDMNDLSVAVEAAGLWVGGNTTQHIENLLLDGNRFLNEANNASYKYGIILAFNIDNLYIGIDNAFYNIKTRAVDERSLVFNQRGPIVEVSLQYGPKTVTSDSLLSDDIVVTGATPGDLAAASFSSDTQDLVLSAVVNTLNTVKVIFKNYTTSDVILDGILFIRISKKVFTQ
jgi:hypothetical protein